jgi:NAD(P)-dependent dehydrogenase (short-subunit alcohol dehydrogenase family)
VIYIGALRCSRAVIPFMKKEGWGCIINIGGGNARNVGLVHMTKTLAVQLGRQGITVNCIHLGTTRTERIRQARRQPKRSVPSPGSTSISRGAMGFQANSLFVCKYLRHFVESFPPGKCVNPFINDGVKKSTLDN